MRSFIKSILVPCFVLALATIGIQACSSDTNSGACVPNSQAACACPGGTMGVQTCQANGTFNTCDCGAGTGGGGSGGSMVSSSSGTAGTGGSMNCHQMAGGPSTCGDGTLNIEIGEECDDGNCDATDACNNNCKLPYCGDKVIQAPETCDGGEQCDADCEPMIIPDAGVDSGPVCEGKLIFAGLAAVQSGAFAYNGEIGIDAATAACQALGGFGMCDYEQWKQLETDPAAHPGDITKLGMTIPPGTCQDVWLQRTTVAMDPTCPGGMSAPGPGGNCNNWNYPTNHVADGEHVNVCNMAGTITYTYNIDCDTIYDPVTPGPHQNNVLACNAMHPIPCCYEKCVEP